MPTIAIGFDSMNLFNSSRLIKIVETYLLYFFFLHYLYPYFYVIPSNFKANVYESVKCLLQYSL